MAIVIREVEDADIPRACVIEGLAYKNNPLGSILAPGPFPPDAAQQRIDQIIGMRKDDPTAKYSQAVDEASWTMIAFAKWHIYQTESQVAASVRPLSFGGGRNKDACTAFFGGMAERKKALMGNAPHIYLHLLHTDPEYQGRGAGGLLVTMITRRADELGLPVYLESSTVAHRFYQNHSFRDFEVLKVDLSAWGGGIHEQPLMIRSPTMTA
ncbi:hypothetical protein ACN47E_005205 [Coniothyrium glycines]